AVPTASQLEAWKRSAPPAARPRFWRSPRLITAIGSGLAAALVLGMFYFVPPGSSQVVASTIFRSLRETARRGLFLQLEDVRIDDLSVTSLAQIVFPEPVNMQQLVELRDLPGPEQLHV